MLAGEFSVIQFFADGRYEYVRRGVDSHEAVKAASHYSTCVGAKLGTTVRVIIADGGDTVNWEWEYGKGVTFPPPTREGG